MSRAQLRRCLLAAIALLYVFSIPWYRTGGATPESIFGMPDWVAIAIACYVAVAILNSLAWRLTDIEEDPERDAE